MITITKLGNNIDSSNISFNLSIKTVDEYPAGYKQIITAIYSETDLSVLVSHPKVSSWLKLLAEHYGPNRVLFQVVDARSLLEKRLGLTIPEEITDHELLMSNLLDLNIPASGQVDFLSYLLDVFFGNFMNKPAAIYRIDEILSVYEPEQWQSALQRPLVNKAFQGWLHKQRQDLEEANQPAGLLLLNWFDKSPSNFFKNLSGLRLLANYPKTLGEHIFGIDYAELSSLGLDLHKIPIDQGNLNVVNEIKVHLNSFTSRPSTESLELLLEQVSGFLEIELEAVIEILKSNNIQVTDRLIKNIQNRFRGLRTFPNVAQSLDDLEQLITVPVPSAPAQDWNADDWLHWATKEYLPYRFWLENTETITNEIGDLAGLYSDWLYSNYNQLRYNSEHMAWRVVNNLVDKLKNHAGPILVIMLDNLNLKFYPVIRRQLHSKGLLEQEYHTCISMLPSTTEISKKCIIMGDYKIFSDPSDYAFWVEGSWCKRLNKKVHYLANIVELREVTQQNKDVYFLNYLPIDFCLHQSDKNSGITHIQFIRQYIEMLAIEIEAFTRRLGAERDLMVIITSDHGSTRIPQGVINVIDNNLYRIHSQDEHHRFITVTDGESKQLPEKIKYECYLFDKKSFDLPENYLVARRLYRFLPTADSVYIHGGLTPEETIVPVAIFTTSLVTPKQIDIKLIQPNKIIAGTKQDLELEITNFNNYPITNIQLLIDDSNLEADQVEIKEIEKLQRRQIKLKSRCVNNADISRMTLSVSLSFEFVDQFHEQKIEVPVKYDTLIKTKFDLDNL